jgi:alpha-galactosidase
VYIMPKITFMGAGSTVFAKNVLGDCILTPPHTSAELSIDDIKSMCDDLIEVYGH